MHLQRNLLTLGALAAVLVVAVWTGPQPARTAFPGTNGRIAFHSYRDGNGEIYVMNSDGTDQTRLTAIAGTDVNPSWSSDGAKIAFESSGEVYSMNANGTGLTNLTNNPGSFDGEPSWSPDGTQIAFRSDRNGNAEVYKMNANGSGQTRLTNNTSDDGFPAWSPDGTEIAFCSERDGDPEIYVMNANGSSQTNITNHSLAADFHPSWSPDGSQIAFHSNRAGNYDVYRMNANGTQVIRLTSNGAFDGAPAWSPDGVAIAFDSYRDGNGEVYVMSADDGGGQTRLTGDVALDGGADWETLPAATPTPTPTATPTKQPAPGDTDGDGCPDVDENGPDEKQGGRRDYKNPWDYFNPTNDGENRVDDILAVVNRYQGPAYYDPSGDPFTEPPPPPAYHPKFDRSYGGPEEWNLGPADGYINVEDILFVVRQYFHDCGTVRVKPTMTPTPTPQP